MGELSQNQILILIKENQTNENEMYIKKTCGKLENENVEIENNKIEENGEQIMKKKLQKLHVQFFFGKGIINFFMLGILLCE